MGIPDDSVSVQIPCGRICSGGDHGSSCGALSVGRHTQSTDRGSLQNLASKNEISVTVILRLRDPDGAENLLSALTTAGDPQFHKFLTPQQFKAQFGPTEADAAKVAANLKRYGLTVARASSLTLHATGTPANIDHAFGVTLHEFVVPAQGRTSAYSFRAPLTRPKVPDAVTGLVTAVVGFDTRPRFRPHAKQAPAILRDAQQCGQNGSANIINSFGSLTVADFAQYYNVKPLYDAGITGTGRTLGIVSLANFTPSDAFAYWQRVGLTVDPGRITIVNIDGGPGAPVMRPVPSRPRSTSSNPEGWRQERRSGFIWRPTQARNPILMLLRKRLTTMRPIASRQAGVFGRDLNRPIR